MAATQAEHSLLKTTWETNTDCGPLTSQLATFSMMKDHVFGNMTTTSTFGNPESFRIVKLEGKGKGKGGFKRIGNAHLGEEQTHDNDWWVTRRKCLVVQGQERQERPVERKEQSP